MFDKFKPRKTEFRGVVFRSKSEACLAKYFHDHKFRWTYEPDAFEVDNYLPDFWVSYEAASGRTVEFVVEYKPSEPTMTYMEGRANDLRGLTLERMTPFAVLCGSFFESEDKVPTKTYVFRPGASDIIQVWNGWFGNNGRAEYYERKAIARNRFDLRGTY